jgi:hypothetical protein
MPLLSINDDIYRIELFSTPRDKVRSWKLWKSSGGEPLIVSLAPDSCTCGDFCWTETTTCKHIRAVRKHLKENERC